MKRASKSAFANPVMVGAVTVLVVLVAVFLAYNANTGLPFVPTRELNIELADGSDLVVGNDVREGGYRVGEVSTMRPIRLPSGASAAQVTVKLQKKNGYVPIDSTATIIPQSVLGLKYLEIQVGNSKLDFPDGGVMPISQTSVPVQFDDIFQTFNPKTRQAIRQSLVGVGDTLAARGSSLNDTFHALPSLLGQLQPVSSYLSSDSTGLTRFLGALDSFMNAVTPVAGLQGPLFGHIATTMAAIDRDPNALKASIAESPSTESVSTQSLRVQQPFLVDLTTLGEKMTPATADLRAALPTINPAIESGSRVLGRTPPLDRKLQGTLRSLRTLSRAPGTNVAINGLRATVGVLNPMVRYLGPFQTVCDYWNYWWTYLAEHLSQPTEFGFAQRVMFNVANAADPDNVGQSGAALPSGTQGGDEFLHAQPYGAAIDNQGNADCETGQRGYVHKLNSLDPYGRNFASDPHTPGDQGPTFAGRPRVPAGETFSRNPQIGPQLPATPSNP